MTLYEFNFLSDDDKALEIWNGAFIADRIEASSRILLYQLYSFYVEVYYHTEQNKIQKFRSFSSTNQLDIYLARIDISHKYK